MENKHTQENDILNYLRSNKDGLTSKEAFNMFGATRLSGVIFNLRKKGYAINSVGVRVKNRYGGHTLVTRYVMEDADGFAE